MDVLGNLYRELLRPAFFRMEAEKAHHLALGALAKISTSPFCLEVLRSQFLRRKPVRAFGLTFPNPIGLAAGFDKNACALPAWAALGFGFVELGTITAQAQPANPAPRLFRHAELLALINRLGFNNDGADAVAHRLEDWQNHHLWPKIPVGINIGKSKATPLEEANGDYVYSFQRLQRFANYVALNVSSPNTPGLRTLQDREPLEALLHAIHEVNTASLQPKPVLLKIAPDLSFQQIEEIVHLAEKHSLAGLIATNTTLDHSSVPEGHDQSGGLSGGPLEPHSTEIVRFIASRSRLPIIAVGGVLSNDDAQRKIDAGATLVQLYTGYIYGGPTLVPQMVAALRD